MLMRTDQFHVHEVYHSAFSRAYKIHYKLSDLTFRGLSWQNMCGFVYSFITSGQFVHHWGPVCRNVALRGEETDLLNHGSKNNLACVAHTNILRRHGIRHVFFDVRCSNRTRNQNASIAQLLTILSLGVQLFVFLLHFRQSNLAVVLLILNFTPCICPFVCYITLSANQFALCANQYEILFISPL